VNPTIRLVLFAAAFVLPTLLMAAGVPNRFVTLDPSKERAQAPFSDAVIAGDTLYVSGVVGAEPGAPGSGFSEAKVPADPSAETRLAMEEIRRIVESAGFRMQDIAVVQVFCTDVSLFGAFNSVYGTYFHDHYPARAFLGVSKFIVGGAHFEIMVTAVRHATQ
jgi:2-iminobutanoate/2-iminopropanoate deaminase